MTKFVVMYKKPKDPAHFARHYVQTHVPLAAKLPGLRSHFHGPAKSLDGSEGEFFWMFVGTFDSAAAVRDALNSPEGQAAVADIPNYHTHPEPPTILTIDDA